MSFLHRVSFHSVPSVPPPGCPERNPNSRVSRAGARARGHTFRGGANRAPDCPDAPARTSRMQAAPHPLAESGAFFTPVRTAERSGPASAAPFLPLPIITHYFIIQVISRIISEIWNMMPLPNGAGAGRLWTRTRSATIGGEGEPTVNDMANDRAEPTANGARARCARRWKQGCGGRGGGEKEGGFDGNWVMSSCVVLKDSPSARQAWQQRFRGHCNTVRSAQPP